jgi:hypothetical protein
MPSPAFAIIAEIKYAIASGETKRQLIARCDRAMRTVENLDRTGEPTPPNTLAVQR